MTIFPHPNPIGSESAFTNYSVTMNNERLYYPWGQYWVQVGPTMDEVYAGLVDDQELMAAQYRRYFPAIDRWLSPDPASLGAVDLSNPQSFNRYAYVMNNPLSLVDPLGLVPPCYWVEDERGEHQVCLSGGGPAGSEGSHPCAKVVFADPHVTPGGCGGQVGGGGGGATTARAAKKGCGAQRISLVAKAAFNFAVADAKFGILAGSVLATPVTGGLSALGIVYGAVGASGNIAAGGIDLVGAATGKVAEANTLATDVSTLTTVSGVVVMAKSGSMEAAASAANLESIGTAGFNGGMTGSLIDKGATAVQSAILATELGSDFLEALGLGETAGCAQTPQAPSGGH